MKHIYSFDAREIELIAAVKVLQGMTEDTISINSTITVETDCDDLAKVLGVMIPQSRQETMNDLLNAGLLTRNEAAALNNEWATLKIAEEPSGVETTSPDHPADGILRHPHFTEKGSGKPALEVKKCKICGVEFTPRRVDQILCLNPNCRKEYARRRVAEHNKKKAEQAPAAPAVTLQEGLEGTAPLSLENHNGHKPQE